MQIKPKTPKLPKLNFAAISIGLLVLLCLVVIIYDFGTYDEAEVLAAPPPTSKTPDILEPPPPILPPPPVQPQLAVVDDSFYIEYRLQREQVRAEELELLQNIIDDPGTSAEMCNLANSRKMAIAEVMGFELMTENVLYAKDFGQTVVMMGRDTATVILSGEMNDILAARVADAVTNVTGISFENVIIINR